MSNSKNSKSRLWDFLDRRLGAASALSLFALLGGLYLTQRGFDAGGLRSLLWTFFYTLVPLATSRLVGVDDLLDDLRDIGGEDGIPPRERVIMMRNALELEVSEWWSLFRKLSEGDRSARRRVADAFRGVAAGDISVLESLFIVGYFLYRAVFREALASLSPPADLVVQAAALTAIVVIGSKRSLAKVIEKIWAILFDDAGDWEAKIRRVEHLIKITCHQYYRFSQAAERQEDQK